MKFYRRKLNMTEWNRERIWKKTPAAANNSCSNEENDSATSEDDSDYEPTSKDSDYAVKNVSKI